MEKEENDNGANPHPSSGLSMDGDELFMAYLMKDIFTQSCSENSNQFAKVCPWLLTVLHGGNQDHNSRSSELAVRALAAAYYGKVHLVQSVVDRGSHLYAQVLCEVRRDLGDPQRVSVTTTLANTLLLALYEMITFQNITGWLTHFLGIGQLVKFRGPARHQSGVDKELFLSARPTIIIAHLVKNQRCFLEERDWKVEPWANCPDMKSAMDYLLDHFCDLPGIFEDLERMQDNAFSQEDCVTTSTMIAMRVKTLVERLFEWRVNWGEKVSGTYYNVGLSTLKGMQVAHLDTYPFATAIFFTEPTRATELCMYDSIIALLYRTWKRLSISMILPSPFKTKRCEPQPSILLTPGGGSLLETVGEICRLVHCQLIGHPGQNGSIQLMFPLQVAYRSAEPGSQEAEWLSAVISHVAEVLCFKAIRYSQSFVDKALIVT